MTSKKFNLQKQQEITSIRAFELVTIMDALKSRDKLEAIPGGKELIESVDEMGLSLYEYKELKEKLGMDKEENGREGSEKTDGSKQEA